MEQATCGARVDIERKHRQQRQDYARARNVEVEGAEIIALHGSLHIIRAS